MTRYCNKSTSLVEAKSMIYNSVAEKVFNVIGWVCLGIGLIAMSVVLLGGNTNTEHSHLFLMVFMLVAFLFTRLRIQYCLSPDTFTRVVTPTFAFGWFNRCVHIKEKNFKYILLTRSSASTQGTGHSPVPKFCVEITHLTKSGLIVGAWDDLISLYECFNSKSAADVYQFALQVQKLTGLEIIIDPLWRDLYEKEIPNLIIK